MLENEGLELRGPFEFIWPSFLFIKKIQVHHHVTLLALPGLGH
jgi:hypothetical protein